MVGWNHHTKKLWYCPDIESIRRSLPHCSEVSVHVFSSLPDLVSDDDLFEAIYEIGSDRSNYSDSTSAPAGSLQTTKMKPFSQGQLNNLVRDLALLKEAAKIFSSRLSEHGILDSKTKIACYRLRDKVLNYYFSEEDNFML